MTTTATEVASALVLLALAYRSGLPTTGVLEAVAAESPETVARDLRQVAAALHWGASDQEAWSSVGPVWEPAGRAVTLAQLAGLAPGPLLLKAADDLAADRLERIDVATAKVGVRLVAPLGLVLLPAFCLTTVVPLVVALARAVLG
ncbi:MAG: type II secretion system F family protein [Intrasporangium sp.]|uniref:type II secretion system F family protein n=1 Tax=Intrasporangium sp. TaxID=1925024 RepID=UPI0026485944|nr:type II secretion system F family protein [Intrasporangium sp.]MDN5797597.1 type II secretion system F family protein [Intrasporangium sp.]